MMEHKFVQITTTFNSYFASVFTKEDLDNIPDMDSFQFSGALTDVSITSEQIYEQHIVTLHTFTQLHTLIESVVSCVVLIP